MAVESVNGKTGVVVLTASNVEAVPTSEVGKPKGVAELNSEGKLVESELPSSVVTSSEIRLVAAPTGVAATDTANIQAALSAGSGTAQLRAGTYVISETLSLPSGVILAGVGVGATILKLPAKAGYDILHSSEWETLKGTASVGGFTNGGFCDLTFNGNRTEETKAPSEASGLVSIFGYAYRCERFEIELAPGNGYISEWGNGSGVPMEAWVSSFKILKTTGFGFLWNGPHDSIVKDAQIIGGEKGGVKTAVNGNATTFDNVHCWAEGMEYQWQLEVEAILVSCQGEGASKAALWVKHNGCRIFGGQYFLSPVGIKMGVVGKEIAGCVLNMATLQGSTACLEIAGNDFRNYYAFIADPALETFASMVKGTLAKSSTLLAYPTNEQGLYIRGLGSEVIETAAIGKAAVTQAKMAENSVGTLQLLNGSVDAAIIATEAITREKLLKTLSRLVPLEQGRSAEMVGGEVTLAAPAVTAKGAIVISTEGGTAIGASVVERTPGTGFKVKATATSTDRVNWAVYSE